MNTLTTHTQIKHLLHYLEGDDFAKKNKKNSILRNKKEKKNE